jgi:sugar phosphate isomerase/epimerase
MPVLSLSPLTVLPAGPIEQIDAAADAGFESIGLRLFPSLPTDIDPMSDPQLLRDIERRLSATGISVLDIEVVRVSPRLDIGALRNALSFASGVGAKWLASTSDSLVDYGSDAEPGVVVALRALCEETATVGMGVMFEFMAFRGVQTLEQAERIVAAAGMPNARVTIDALHLFRSGGTVEAIAAQTASSFACLQVCDGPADAPADLPNEARTNRLFAGEGELPLVELVRAMPVDLPISVEVPSRAHAHLSPRQRAHLAMDTTRRLIDDARGSEQGR